MGAKGTVDTKIDAGALNEIIVFSNYYKREVEESATKIQTLCRQMEDEESLKGGDGDAIRDSFKTIAKGITQVSKSAGTISAILDKKLGKALGMKKGSFSNNAADAATQAANKAGVIKKD